MASALEVICKETTRETRIFIRNVDKFFDCLNVKSPILGRHKRNDNILPYSSARDERFKVDSNLPVARVANNRITDN